MKPISIAAILFALLAVLAGWPSKAISTQPKSLVTQSLAINRPCMGQDKLDHQSALCAQWRGTVAAEKSAEAAQSANVTLIVGTTLSFISIILVLIAIRQTRKAQFLSEESLNLARNNSQRELRAYVVQDGISFTSHFDPEKGVRWLRLTAKWRNAGNTPTVDLAVQVWPLLSEKEMPGDFTFDKYVEPGPAALAAGGVIESDALTLTAKDGRGVRDGKLFFYIWGWARYRDVFDGSAQHQTRFCVRITMLGEPALPISDTNVLQIFSSPVGIHNDAT